MDTNWIEIYEEKLSEIQKLEADFANSFPTSIHEAGMAFNELKNVLEKYSYLLYTNEKKFLQYFFSMVEDEAKTPTADKMFITLEDWKNFLGFLASTEIMLWLEEASDEDKDLFRRILTNLGKSKALAKLLKLEAKDTEQILISISENFLEGRDLVWTVLESQKKMKNADIQAINAMIDRVKYL